jgi:putative transposase
MSLRAGDAVLVTTYGRTKLFVVESCQAEHITLRDTATNAITTMSNRSIRKLYMRNEFVCIEQTDDMGFKDKVLERSLQLEWESRSEIEREVGIRNAEAMRYLDRVGPRANGLTPIIVNELYRFLERNNYSIDGLGRSQLYVYRRRWIESGGLITSVCPAISLRGNTNEKMDGEVRSIVVKAIKEIFLTRQRKSKDHLYGEVLLRVKEANDGRALEEQLKVPSKSYINSRIDDLDPYLVDLARYGEQMARQRHGGFGEGQKATRPLEMVQIDHTPLDRFAIDYELSLVIGRVYLTVAIDQFTRCILGFWIDTHPPSYSSIANCIRHAVSFKDDLIAQYPSVQNSYPCAGVFGLTIVDRGSDLKSYANKAGVTGLFTNIEYTKKKSPWLKGAVERFFRTLNKDHFQGQPGTTFSNYLQLHGYRPDKDKLVTLPQIKEAMYIFVVDIYHQKIHRALNAKPIDIWCKYIQEFPPRMPARALDLDMSLAEEIKPKAVHQYGVDLDCIRYGKPTEISRIRNHAKYNPTKRYRTKILRGDLTQIFVLNDANVWVELTAHHKDQYAGLTRDHWEILRKYSRVELGASIDKIGVAEAIRRFAAIFERGVKAKHGRIKRSDYNDRKLGELLNDRDARPPVASQTPDKPYVIGLDDPIDIDMEVEDDDE